MIANSESKRALMAATSESPMGMSHRPVRGKVGGKEVIISGQGRVLIDGKEIKDGPASLVQSLGLEIGSSDEESERQWGWSKKLLSEVAGMILRTDQATRLALSSGETKIEDVVERAVVLVDKIMAVQIGYEQGRLKVAHLDTAQATAEAMRRVLENAAHNWWNWTGVPEEMKQVVVGVLQDYRQAQAVVMAAEMPEEMVKQGLDNLKAIAAAKVEVEVGRKQQLLLVAKQKMANERENLREKNQIEVAKKKAEVEQNKAWWQGLVDVVANATSRSGKGLADVLRYHGTQLTGYFMDKEKGLLPMTADVYEAMLEKLREPKVVGGSTGIAVSLIGTTLVITAVGLASAPLAVVTVPLVYVAAGLAGAGLGASIPEQLKSWMEKLPKRGNGG